VTGKERMQCLLSGRIPDRMGLFEHFWPETLSRVWVQQGYPKDADPVVHFDYDIVTAGVVDLCPLGGQYEQLLQETDEWKMVRNGWGATVKLWKEKSGTPEHVDFAVTDPAVWNQYKQKLLDTGNRLQLDNARQTLQRGRSENRFSCFCHAAQYEVLRAMLGDVVMLESMALQGDWIKDICQTFADVIIDLHRKVFAQVGKPDGMFIYEDLGYHKTTFCSPRMYRELIWPYHKQIFDFYHGEGLPVILHSCGNMRQFVPDLIEAGIDCLQPMEVKAGMDVIELADHFGEKIAFMGNIDIRVVESGDPAAMENEIGAKMEALKARGARYVFHSDHSISSRVRLDTYRQTLDIFRKHCWYQ